MRRSAVAAILLGLVTLTLTVVAVRGVFANPTVDSPSYSIPYTCPAPWDTVLNGADTWPGGESPPDAAEIASQCRTAGEERFAVARVAAIAAVGTGIAALVTGLTTTRRTRRDSDGIHPRCRVRRRSGRPSN